MTRPAFRRDADDLLRPSLDDAATADACFDLLAPRAGDGPHEHLMLSILLDAVIQLQRRGTTNAAATARWIRGEEGMGGAAVPFRAVCDALRIDADLLARGLLRGAASRDRLRPAAPPHLPRRQPPRHRRRHRDATLARRPLLMLWMILLAALVRAPLWVRVATGAGLAILCVGVEHLLLP